MLSVVVNFEELLTEWFRTIEAFKFFEKNNALVLWVVSVSFYISAESLITSHLHCRNRVQ
jgi:hypothetical protein